MILELNDGTIIETNKISVLRRGEQGKAVVIIDGAKMTLEAPYEDIRRNMLDKAMQKVDLAY